MGCMDGMIRWTWYQIGGNQRAQHPRTELLVSRAGQVGQGSWNVGYLERPRLEQFAAQRSNYIKRVLFTDGFPFSHKSQRGRYFKYITKTTQAILQSFMSLCTKILCWNGWYLCCHAAKTHCENRLRSAIVPISGRLLAVLCSAALWRERNFPDLLPVCFTWEVVFSSKFWRY